jgi:flavin reductase (DIM6/NTAB) family NADH-FMN oxidoreductase RutF
MIASFTPCSYTHRAIFLLILFQASGIPAFTVAVCRAKAARYFSPAHILSHHNKEVSAMKSFPIQKVYRLMEPSPIVLVSTYRGKPNLMTMGFHMMIQHDPPLIGAVIGDWDYSYMALTSTRECVIAIPGVDLAKKVVDIGNCSGQDVDKFKKFNLTPLPAKKVKAPLVGQCLANIECKVADTRMVNKYSLFILEAVSAYINPGRKEQRTLHHQGNGTFKVDGRTIDLRKRMVKWKEFAD